MSHGLFWIATLIMNWPSGVANHSRPISESTSVSVDQTFRPRESLMSSSIFELPSVFIFIGAKQIKAELDCLLLSNRFLDLKWKRGIQFRVRAFKRRATKKEFVQSYFGCDWNLEQHFLCSKTQLPIHRVTLDAAALQVSVEGWVI